MFCVFRNKNSPAALSWLFGDQTSSVHVLGFVEKVREPAAEPKLESAASATAIFQPL
jgi:hypothetical protein